MNKALFIHFNKTASIRLFLQ